MSLRGEVLAGINFGGAEKSKYCRKGLGKKATGISEKVDRTLIIQDYF